MDVRELSLLNFLEELALVFGSEGVVALQHDVEEYAERPHIGIDGWVVDFRDDFWSHVGGCSAEGVDGAIAFAFETEAEVDEFELSVAIDEDVLGLYVAVDDVLVVQVLQCLSYDQYELFSLSLG